MVLISVIALGCVESQPSQTTLIKGTESTIVSTPISRIQTNPFNVSCNFIRNGRDALTVTGVVINNGEIEYKYNKVGYSVYDKNNVFLWADYINPVKSYIAYPRQPNEFVIVSIVDERISTQVDHVICTARPNE